MGRSFSHHWRCQARKRKKYTPWLCHPRKFIFHSIRNLHSSNPPVTTSYNKSWISHDCKVRLCIGYTMRWRSLQEQVYTIETETELYNQLLSWAIAMRVWGNRYKKQTVRHGLTHFVVLKDGRNGTPRNFMQHCLLMHNLDCVKWNGASQVSESEQAEIAHSRTCSGNLLC